MNTFLKSALGTSLAIAVAACGGGGGSNDAATTGQLNLAITDAPVDGAAHVYVTITGVKLKRSGSDEEKLIAMSKTARAELDSILRDDAAADGRSDQQAPEQLEAKSAN